MQIRKEWLNQLKNLLNKYFKEYIFGNFLLANPIKMLKSLYPIAEVSEAVVTSQGRTVPATSLSTCPDQAVLRHRNRIFLLCGTGTVTC
jgi:hypothetical protein